MLIFDNDKCVIELDDWFELWIFMKEDKISLYDGLWMREFVLDKEELIKLFFERGKVYD